MTGESSVKTPDPGSAPSVDLRGVFHMINATWGVLAYHFVVGRTLAIAAVASLSGLWTLMEVLRVRIPSLNRQVLEHRFFRQVIRPHEHYRISGGVWFGWGVLACLVFFPREAVEVGCLVMGFGDSSAHLVGTRWGRTRLLGPKSLEGSAAFLLGGFAAAFLFRVVFYEGVGFGSAAAMAGVVAVVGATVEALSLRVNDNFTVPLAASAACLPFIT